MNDKSKVLIIDDESEVGEILAILLEEHFACSVFSKAEEALHAIESNHFEYIISDLEMPEMQGLAFLQKAHIVSPKSLLFIATGHDFYHPKVQNALAGRVHGILYKPFADPDTIARMLLQAAHRP